MNRFQGTNIDTLRANHPLPSDQPAAEAQDKHLRDSVGPPFSPPPRVYNDFSIAMQQTVPANVKPMGMSNEINQCYRNAVLTMLINCDVFVAYARWHLDNESHLSTLTTLRGSRVLRFLTRMARINESQRSRDIKQKELDDIVAGFWEAAAFPLDAENDSHKTIWPPKGPWGALPNVKDYQQEDAAEFLSWLLDTIDGQLAHHHDSKDLRVSNTGKTSAQQNFDWFSMSSTTTRIDCRQCIWHVHQRSRVERARPLVVNVNDTDEQSQPMSLHDCISKAFRYALPEDYRCDRCKRSNTQGLKLLTIQHTPNLLLIHLNRTAMEEATYNDDGTVNDGGFYKDPRAVIIPEALEVSAWLNHHQFGPGSKVSYRLAGLVSHKGPDMHRGHYLSYVRGGQVRDKWFKLDDHVVTETASTSRFDDSNATDPRHPGFANRSTPVILLYEKDTANELILPGYDAVNVNEGEDADVRPTRWTGSDMLDVAGGLSPSASARASVPSSSSLSSPPPSSTSSPLSSSSASPVASPSSHSSSDAHFNHFNVPGSTADSGMSGASVDVTIKIGDDIEVQFPRCYIDQLDRKKKRKIAIKARLSATKSGPKKVTASDHVKEVHLDLLDAWFETEVERRERVEEQESLAHEARGKGKTEDDVEQYVDKKLQTWDRKRKRTPWPSRWTADEGSAPTRKQPPRQVKKARVSGHK